MEYLLKEVKFPPLQDDYGPSGELPFANSLIVNLAVLRLVQCYIPPLSVNQNSNSDMARFSIEDLEVRFVVPLVSSDAFQEPSQSVAQHAPRQVFVRDTTCSNSDARINIIAERGWQPAVAVNPNLSLHKISRGING